MRAAEDGRHISGAENIVPATQLGRLAHQMVERALCHPKGEPGSITISVDRVDPAAVRRVKALPVVDMGTRDTRHARHVVVELLEKHTPHAQQVWEHLIRVRTMRGAMLVDADTTARLEPDLQRGVRVSRMGEADTDAAAADVGTVRDVPLKSAAREAIVLATKVLSHPDIIAEVCISDDPDYTTGYVADDGGYHRIPNIKRRGSHRGGRAFLCRSDDVDGLITYLESAPVLVEGIGE